MFKRLTFITLIFIALQSGGIGGAGAAVTTMSHPWFNASNYDDQAIWFAGFWHGAILLRLDPTNSRWETFYYNGVDFCCRNAVVFEKDSIVFTQADKKAIAFQKENKTWKTLESFDSNHYVGYSAYKKYPEIEKVDRNVSGVELEQNTVTYNEHQYIGLSHSIYKIHNNKVINSFHLPVLTVETLLKYRPKVREHFGYDESRHTFSDVVSGLEQSIGPMVLRGDRIWFGITFYEGEGFEDVGGLGFFDLKKEQFGILRLPSLLDCSITQLEFEGDKLWMLTDSRGEGGDYRCTGLVSYDTSNGEYSIYTVPLKPYDDLSYLSFVKVGSSFWLSTPQGIAEFDMKNNRWKVWAMDRLQLTQDTEVLSGIVTKDVAGPFIKLGKVTKGEVYDLWWAEISGGSSYFEIKTPFNLTGWVSEMAYTNLQAAERPGELALSTPLYEDQDLTHLIGYLIAADLRIQEKKQKQLKVTTQQGWIPSETAAPMVRLVKQVEEGGVKTGQWPGKGEDIISLMLKTAESERAAKSQNEKEEKLVKEEICFIDSSQEIMKTIHFCKVSTEGSVGLIATVFNIEIKTPTGMVRGIPNLMIALGGYKNFNISPDGYDFFDSERTMKKHESIEKGQKYEVSDHRYHLTAEILDFQTKTVTIGSAHPVSHLLFDRIVLKATLTQYPLVE